jgi:tRNA pseudouridine38-40 synthase
MQRNFRFRLAYDGTAFSGWQIQPNAPTVQGALERALAELTQQPCRVRGAGPHRRRCSRRGAACERDLQHAPEL